MRQICGWNSTFRIALETTSRSSLFEKLCACFATFWRHRCCNGFICVDRRLKLWTIRPKEKKTVALVLTILISIPDRWLLVLQCRIFGVTGPVRTGNSFLTMEGRSVKLQCFCWKQGIVFVNNGRKKLGFFSVFLNIYKNTSIFLVYVFLNICNKSISIYRKSNKKRTC